MCELKDLPDDDKIVEEQFKATVEHVPIKNPEPGKERDRVRLSWRTPLESPPTNNRLALGRMKNTLRRLRQTPALLKKYNNIILDQQNSGVVEIVEK